MSQKTRSTLRIDAVAQAAAAGMAGALNPLSKINQIAALAGFVLRLFRSKGPGPDGTAPAKAEVKPEYGQSVAKPRRKANPAAALEKGGTRHGQR